MKTQTDRQTDRQTEKQEYATRETDRQEHTDRQTGTHRKTEYVHSSIWIILKLIFYIFSFHQSDVCTFQFDKTKFLFTVVYLSLSPT